MEQYLLLIFEKAIEDQTDLVHTNYLNIEKASNPKADLLKQLDEDGYGQFVVSTNEYGEYFESFTISHKGIARAKGIKRKARRAEFWRTVKRNGLSIFNAIAAFVAALAAVAAAYFSYLSLAGS